MNNISGKEKLKEAFRLYDKEYVKKECSPCFISKKTTHRLTTVAAMLLLVLGIGFLSKRQPYTDDTEVQPIYNESGEQIGTCQIKVISPKEGNQIRISFKIEQKAESIQASVKYSYVKYNERDGSFDDIHSKWTENQSSDTKDLTVACDTPETISLVYIRAEFLIDGEMSHVALDYELKGVK